MNWAEMFNTYAEACTYFGVDTPDQLRAEAEEEAREEREAQMDALEAGVEPMSFEPEEIWPF